MGKIIFILGGARSGKSAYAIKMAKRAARKVAFIATCLPLDAEMKKRIQLHKVSRPRHWQTFVQPGDVYSLLKRSGPQFSLLLIDCLTLLLSNLLSSGLSDRVIEKKINQVLKLLKRLNTTAIIVANQVGCGIVPQNRLARRFRDLAGRVNQSVARVADQVVLLTAGLPVKIK